MNLERISSILFITGGHLLDFHRGCHDRRLTFFSDKFHFIYTIHSGTNGGCARSIAFILIKWRKCCENGNWVVIFEGEDESEEKILSCFKISKFIINRILDGFEGGRGGEKFLTNKKNCRQSSLCKKTNLTILQSSKVTARCVVRVS